MSRVFRRFSASRLAARADVPTSVNVPRRRLVRAAVTAVVVALTLPAVAAAAPATPTSLQVNATGPKQVALTWKASTTPNITGYTIYRNGTAIAVSDLNSPNYVDQSASLVNGTAYTYTVDAYDSAGHSALSTSASGTPASAPTTFLNCYSGSGSLSVGHYTLGADLTAAAGHPCFTFGSATASFTFYRRKLFHPRQWVHAIVGTLVGALTGAIVAHYLPAEWLNKMLPVIVFACGLYLLFGGTPKAPLDSDAPIKKKWQSTQGFGLGFYDGVAGPGTGAFWTVSSLLLYPIDLVKASGVARSMNFVSNAAAWVHLDIYGWAPEARPARPQGGTDQGVRAVYNVLKQRYS